VLQKQRCLVDAKLVDAQGFDYTIEIHVHQFTGAS
jgi:hypothetical protein